MKSRVREMNSEEEEGPAEGEGPGIVLGMQIRLTFDPIN